MLFKNKGLKRYLNKLPLWLQSIIYCLNYKVLLAFIQIITYLGIVFYIIYKAIIKS